MNKKRILVTGGAGFLGSHLCEQLLDRGYYVICVDNLQTGRFENIEHLLDSERFSFVEHDIVKPFDFAVDEIFNLACPASPPQYQVDPVHTLKTSVYGVINLLDLARKYHAKILQASTSEVYGDPHEHPQNESYWGNVNPDGPRACYDEGKRCAETLFFDYHRRYGLPIKVARIFNTYGPRMHPDDGRVVSNFAVQALKSEPITVYGEGKQTRSFCYVDDLVRGFLTLMNTPYAITGPINLGNPLEITVLELAHRIINLADSGSVITFREMPQDDPVRRKPDITLANELLGWRPRVELDAGLQNTIAYFARTLALDYTVEASQKLLADNLPRG